MGAAAPSMVLPVAEFTLKYQDRFVLDIPVAPPREVARSFNAGSQAELDRLLAAPKVKHKIRLVNGGDAPLTTAPALLMRDGQMLAQALVTYTPPGESADLELGTAVDISVRDENREARRVPDAMELEGEKLMRIELDGTIRLVNSGKKALTVEVNRDVLGKDFNYLTPGMKLVLPENEKADVLTSRPGETYR